MFCVLLQQGGQMFPPKAFGSKQPGLRQMGTISIPHTVQKCMRVTNLCTLSTVVDMVTYQMKICTTLLIKV